MASDIHWIVERRHPDGTWESVMHDCESFANVTRPGGEVGTSHNAFDRRDFVWFDILSGIENNVGGPWLAENGLPPDASAFACEALDWDADANSVDILGRFHNHGWILLDDLIDAKLSDVALPILLDADMHNLVKARVDAFCDLLRIAGPDGPRTIFRGRLRDTDPDVYHPDMIALSAHERLALAKREAEFDTMTGFNIRLLIAYDD